MKTVIVLTGCFMMMGSACIAQDSIHYPVILSSRWFHPNSPHDTLSTLRMVDLYKPDRLDWMYCTNAEQLAQLRAKNIPYSLALNPQVPDSAGYTTKGRVIDINGKKLVAPWMRNWKQKNANWGCVNSPEFERIFYAHSRKLIDLEAYGLFLDDARFNDQAIEWGGCFCDYCMDGFTVYLKSKGVDTLREDFNYRNFLLKRENRIPSKNQQPPLWNQFRSFQTQSVTIFLQNWKREMQIYAKRSIVFLTNNYDGKWTEIYNIFDIGIAELPKEHLTEDFINECIVTANHMKKRQYFSLMSNNYLEQIEAILLAHKSGSSLVVPWDIYVPRKIDSDFVPIRYFGPNELFSTIYNLLRIRTARNSVDVNKIQITSLNKCDFIHITTCNIEKKYLFNVESKMLLDKHHILLRSEKKIAYSRVHIIYPLEKEVKFIQRGNNLELEYHSNPLILTVE